MGAVISFIYLSACYGPGTKCWGCTEYKVAVTFTLPVFLILWKKRDKQKLQFQTVVSAMRKLTHREMGQKVDRFATLAEVVRGDLPQKVNFGLRSIL